MRMEGGARRVTQVRRREAMIASQHAAGNYNAIFPHSLSLHTSLTPSAIHTFMSYRPMWSMLHWGRVAK